MAGGLVLFCAPEQTIRLLLGEEWMGASSMLGWLGIYGALFPIDGCMKQMLIAQGRLATLTKIRLAQLATMGFGLAVAASLQSIQAVVGTTVITWVLGTLLSIIANHQVGGRAVLEVFVVPLLAALGAAVALHWAGQAGWLDALPYWSILFLLPAVYALLIGLLEARKLASEFHYLREQMREAN